jgi:hypothetical protein
VILVLGVWSGLPPSRFLGGDGGQAKDGGDEKGMVSLALLAVYITFTHPDGVSRAAQRL